MHENCDGRWAVRITEIAERARTLDEILAGFASGLITGSQVSEDPRYGRWLDAVAAGDRSAFLRRLNWDSRPETTGAPPRSVEVEWIPWVKKVFELARSVAAELSEEKALAEEALCLPEEPIPFFELWVPFLRNARMLLRNRIGAGVDLLSPSALYDIERQLLTDLAARGVWAAYEAFDLWRSQSGEILPCESGKPGRLFYNAFILKALANGLGDFFVRYSSLARRLATAAACWVEATAEMTERLANDFPELESVLNGGGSLGQVTKVERLSEPHGGGRRVMALTMSGGRKLVYKPRPVACEAAFQDLLCELATKGLTCAPAPFKMVSRYGYGWSEWLEPAKAKDLAEVERYFERAGALLCLVELLGGDDLHAENVVATAGGPVLIDAETLFQPLIEEETPATPPHFRSQLATSLQVDAAGRSHDQGGLQGSTRWLGETRRPVWCLVNTDAVSVDYQPAYMEPGANVLYWKGRPSLPGDHRDALARGFSATYRFLLEHRGELLADEGLLAAFRSASSRVVLRPSQSYAALVARLRQARFQGTGMSTDTLIETSARPFVCHHVRPRVWDVIAEERKALRQGDIPRFEVPVGDTRIELPGGGADCFSLSGFEATRRRIHGLSDTGLAEWLKALKRLWAPPTARQRTRPESCPPVDPVGLSLALGRNLVEGRGMGRARGLYEGGLGVALFIAALARLTGDRPLGVQAANLALKELARALPKVQGGAVELGSFTGLGGDLYGSACITHWLGDSAVADAAVSRLRQVGPRDLDGASPDLAAGLAGCILGALAFAAVTGEPAARELAEIAGERLAARVGDCVISQPGVAHGFAGISLAFLRLAETGGDRDWAVLARRAWEREWEVRAQAFGFLPGLTRQGLGWCRGSSGLGLVALELLRAEPAEDRPLELTMAVAAVREDWTSDLDSLCCGMGGEIELLLQTPYAPGFPSLAHRLDSLCTTWWRRLAANGLQLDRDRLGRNRHRAALFRGSAGIGYQLLRTSQPDRWPSILTFQPPAFVENDRR